RDEKMQAKIRDAQLQKVPYMLVVGEREEKADSASVRLRSGQDLGEKKVGEITDIVKKVAASRIIDLWP
ncbi:MAG: His/Gly/Thr/Pro-type tRNA ligase C-terminal domain-containing protein, partial [Patescibacteria group bacterium]